MKKLAAFTFFMLLLAGCGTAEQAKQGEQTEQTNQTDQVQTEDGTFVGQAGRTKSKSDLQKSRKRTA
ncbi:hypothetical protein ABWK31_20780 [Bacillus sp. JJ353]|uniref:hypothetical protein n=1 Tax=Bacillus sp. JJ353 TaxID=3122967 RepID=UPI0033995DD2